MKCMVFGLSTLKLSFSHKIFIFLVLDKFLTTHQTSSRVSSKNIWKCYTNPYGYIFGIGTR